MTAIKPTPDWEKIEAEYRVGVKSLREIGEPFGITEGAIRKRAKRDDWTRDLSEKVRVKAADLVRKQAVRSEVRTGTEKELVTTTAALLASVELTQRKDVAKARGLVMRLFDELEKQMEGAAKATTASRVDAAKKLSEALGRLVTLERTVYGIVDSKTVEVIDKTPKGLSHFYANAAYPNASDEATDDGDA